MALSTTIKVKPTTKARLARARQSDETFDAAIERLLNATAHLDTLNALEEGYRQSAQQDRLLLKEWEQVDRDLP